MTDRPIIFSAPMVRALLDGRKTQTRRVLKPQPESPRVAGASPMGDQWVWRDGFDGSPLGPLRLPYTPGDRLYVRESLKRQETDQGVGYMTYAADGAKVQPLTEWHHQRHSIPSIHMPRWASRLTLTVTDVRVQRLQDISEEDAVAEGCEARIGQTWWQGYRDMGDGVPLLHQTYPGDEPPSWMIDPKPAGRSKWEDRSAAQAFRTLWNSLHGPDAWGANPWVAAITFTVEKRNIDEGGE